MLKRLRPSRQASILLAVVWGLMLLFVVSNLSEDARGDSYFVGFIRGDFEVGGVLTGGIFVIDRWVRGIKGTVPRRG